MGTGMNNTVYELANLPSGDLVAGGGFATLGTAVNNLARWNGSSWSAVTAGAGVDGAVYGMTMTAGGDLAICGAFWKVNGGWSAYFARLRPTCLATAVPYGSGCSGSGGLNTLAATALPWMGNTFRAQAMGMPATAFVLAVTGFAPISIPMPAIFAQGVPGCSALVYPDFLDLSLPAAGTAQSQVALPATPALIGQSFYHQIVAIEVDLSFAFTAITSTNALTLTIGGF
jgi:hypothetical protein